MISRICYRCGKEKQLNEFVKCKSCKMGYSYLCRVCSNIDSRRYYRSHPEREIARRQTEKYKVYTKEYKQRIKSKVFEILGNKCNNPYNLPHPDWCNDMRCLQIDHIIREQKYKDKEWAATLYLQIIRMGKEEAKKRYQLLCANCNWIKRWKNEEFDKK